jgi:chromate transporter
LRVTLVQLFWVCFQTSLVAFGGVHGGLPEWHRVFVVQHGWLTNEQLMESYVVGQLAPGPSMVVAVLLGQRVAGTAGACAAFLGTYSPPLLFSLLLDRLLGRARQVPWMKRVGVAVRPLVVGFMAAAALGILRTQWNAGAPLLVLVGAVAAITYVRGLLGPVPLMLSSGAGYWLLSIVVLR